MLTVTYQTESPSTFATKVKVFGISCLNTGPTAITNSMEMSLRTHIRRSTEQRRKKMEKVVGWIASYRTAPRMRSTKACVKKLNKKWLLDLCEMKTHAVLTGLP